jgi:spermidine synthase
VTSERVPADVPGTDSSRRIPLAGLLLLFWLSGAAALVYEVLWLKQLGRLFGVTAYASSTTLAVFFLGLSLGGLVWGRRAQRLNNPLRTYAWLEVGIAASALLYFALFDVYAAIQEPLFGGADYSPGTALAVKFLLSVGILILPSFLMGGTLPVMAQYLVARREQLGSSATLLYAANTAGATVGALLAGFVLPRLFGFKAAYGVAIAFNLFVAAQTWWWSRTRQAPAMPADPEVVVQNTAQVWLEPRSIRVLAALSGLATLGLEVLWTRMVSQVLQNSVYTFSLILATFLLALAVGATVANRLARRVTELRRVMGTLLLVSGVLVAITPFQFQVLASRLEFWNSGLGFWPYMGVVFLGLLLILGPAVVFMGAVFPFLMRLSERSMVNAGRTVGELAAINTAFAIVGSLVAGFVLLQWIGLWASIWIVAAIYLVAAVVVASRRELQVGAGVCAALSLVLAATLDFDVLRLEAVTDSDESIVESWEGPDGTVAVTRFGEGELRLRVNSSYSLGSSASAPNERMQGQLPMLLHPDARSVFFLGLGTGITASGAMQFPFERVVVCEVNPGVIRAAREHFQPWLRGLFEDPRVRVIPEDGRTWLAANPERYDLIIADIFLTYKIGVGSLYTREHFEVVRERLEPGGTFVQWLPMFDTSIEEFRTIVRTMQDVFPSVTLWRRSFSPVFPVYALVGCMEETPLSMEGVERGLATLREDPDLDERTWLFHLPLAAFVADLSARADDFADAPLNTDDRTRLEYSAPMTERESKGAGRLPVLAWETLLRYCEDLQASQEDSFLSEAKREQKDQVLAGTAYYGYEIMRRMGRSDDAARYLELYQSLIP